MNAKFAEFDEMMMKKGMGKAAPDEVDDFAAARIEQKSDIGDLFVPKFFFGCESDDPTVTYASLHLTLSAPSWGRSSARISATSMCPI